MVTGMPIGVVNVAIVDAAIRSEQRFARGIALGAALADTVHAALAFVGVARLLAERPEWTRAMAVIAAAAIAVHILATRRLARTSRTARRAASGFATGVLLTLPNPAALGAWVAVAAVLWPTIALAPALALAGGVGIGSALWFTLLARWIATLPGDGRIARTLPTVALVLLAAIAVVGVVRAFG